MDGYVTHTMAMDTHSLTLDIHMITVDTHMMTLDAHRVALDTHRMAPDTDMNLLWEPVSEYMQLFSTDTCVSATVVLGYFRVLRPLI